MFSLTHCRYLLTRALRSSLFLVGTKTDSLIFSSFLLSSSVKESSKKKMGRFIYNKNTGFSELETNFLAHLPSG